MVELFTLEEGAAFVPSYNKLTVCQTVKDDPAAEDKLICRNLYCFWTHEKEWRKASGEDSWNPYCLVWKVDASEYIKFSPEGV